MDIVYNVASHGWPVYICMAVVLMRALGQLALGFFALKRAETKDIPVVVQELARWWHRWPRRRES